MSRVFSKKNINIFVLSILPLIFYFGIWILTHYNTHSICIFKLVTNIDCPGCGIIRAFSELFRLNFQEAYNYNPRIIIIAPLLFFTWFSTLAREIKCAQRK